MMNRASAKLPKRTVDVQVTTMDAVLEFTIEVATGHPCHACHGAWVGPLPEGIRS